MFDSQKFQQILARLPRNFPESAIAVHHYEVLQSTNITAGELLEKGASFPLIVIADRQTAGRGQWGRKWQSDRGGLYLSLGMATNSAIGIHLTFSSGWGIASALRREGIPVSLKWPNDLILDGKKLGGIKTVTRHQRCDPGESNSPRERASRQSPVTSSQLPVNREQGTDNTSPLLLSSSLSHAVIGVGINWENQPPEPGIALASVLQDRHGASIADRESLAAIATHGILSGYHYYLTEGVDALLSSYWELAIAKGRSVTVNGAPGTIVGVTPRGELRIRLQSPGAATEICCPPGAIALGYNTKDKNFGERSLHKKS
ncbi:MAG: biotin--[acetyl-CoA-carboxylase] ligase [Spirulina sp.]